MAKSRCKLIKYFIWIIISGWFFISVCSCKRSDPSLEHALDFAGRNKTELEKVLAHYSKDPADSLKLKAARFLIINMPYHYGYYGKEINRYSNIFSLIDTFSYTHENISNEDRAHIGDSIVGIYGEPDPDSINKEYDSKIITADYLIKNIDFAFKALQQTAWGKKIPFDDFCEYILPYRIKNEQIDEWRPGYYQRYTKMLHSAPKPDSLDDTYGYMKWQLGGETAFDISFDKYFPFDQSVGDIEKGRIGSCEITAFAAVTAMRSVGLPVGYDYIMHWGTSNSRHYMPALTDRFDSIHLITNENVQEDTWHLVDFSSEFNANRHKFLPSEMPKGLYVQNVKTIPKVYRFTYSQSQALLSINKNVPKEYISPEFQQTNLKDVTDEYVTIANVKIPTGKEVEKYKVGYLTVFDISGWQPVAIAEMKNDQIVFNKLGKETVYLPTVYYRGEHHPIGAPFYIDSANNVRRIVADTVNKQSMTLLRKFPLYTYTAYHSEILKGGRFEGSNDSLFTHPTLLYEIKNYPFFVNTVPTLSKKTFRYVRYAAPSDADFEPDNIAEVQFKDDNDKPLKGKLIGIDGIEGHEIDKAFDGDLNSYYQNYRNRDGRIGIDLGKSNKRSVKSIMFCPRNDTDGIIPGQEYELFYWDGEGWVSLGVQTARDYKIEYKSVPTNGLYWLRCNSGGTEERIFTYQNGKQIWW